MNRPREGNVPGQPVHEESGPPDNRHSLERKVESGLAEPRRDTQWNRYIALHRNGWTVAEYDHWCRTGESPDIREMIDKPMVPAGSNVLTRAFDDDEVLKR